MRRSPLAALAITGLIAVAPAAQAQTQPFSASFKGIQTRNEPPCAAGVLCGSGSISGFGDATNSALPVSLGPVSGSCQALTALVFIDLTSGQGSLTLLADGDLCWPGKSHDTPGSLHCSATRLVSTAPTRSPMEPGSSRSERKWLSHPANRRAHTTSSTLGSARPLGRRWDQDGSSDGIRIAGPVIGLHSVVPSSIRENAAPQERRFHVHRFIPTPPVFGSVA